MEHQVTGTQTNQAQYHHVAVWKFVLLGLCTLGLYELYWFYKSWKFVRERDQSDISPFWRAFFAPIWFYSLDRDIANHTSNSRSSAFSGTLAFLYFVIQAAWRLPEPYWLISFLTVAVMLPMVFDVNSINRRAGVMADTYRRITFKHAAVAIIGIPIFAFTIISSLDVIPNTAVVSGDQLPTRVVSMLQDKEILEANEAVIYYYSSALVSYADDGNYFTKQRVVSYWQEDGNFYIEQARYQEIENIEVEYTNSALEDTQVTIFRQDGSGFLLLVSGEDERDREFVETLRKTWGAGKAVL